MKRPGRGQFRFMAGSSENDRSEFQVGLAYCSMLSPANRLQCVEDIRPAEQRNRRTGERRHAMCERPFRKLLCFCVARVPWTVWFLAPAALVSAAWGAARSAPPEQ